MNGDLFDASFVNSVKKSLTPEQLEEYEKIGEYMYNNDGYKVVSMGSKINEPLQEEIIAYAMSALRSGLPPSELSQKEIDGIRGVYGDKWYENFGYTKDDIPVPTITMPVPQGTKKEREILRRRPRNNK